MSAAPEQVTVPASSRKPIANAASPAATARAIITLAHRGLLKLRHHPQRLFDVVLLPVILTTLFAGVFGGAISGTVKEYLPLLIPGVMVQLAVTAAVITGVQVCEDVDSGISDRLRSLPIARVAPVAGALLADTVRYVVGTTMTILSGVLMGYRPASWLGLVAGGVLVVIAGFALSWIFAFLGVLISRPTTVQAVSMLVVTPLSFMSNALVPANSMPDWMQTFALINPVSSMVTAVRALSAGQSAGPAILGALAGCLLVMVIMVPLTVRWYGKR